jgi:LmbE family N-acetylglucosaminyl deacetylase
MTGAPSKSAKRAEGPPTAHDAPRKKEGGAVGPQVLFVFPHPDDEVSCGGLIARSATAGTPVEIVIMSSGGHNGKADVRERESLQALQILGVPQRKVHFARFADTRIPASHETVRYLNQFLGKQVAAVFLPAPEDAHLDHQAVTAAGLAALRHVPNVFFYATPSTQSSFHPDTYVDISPFMTKKLWAVRCYRSQAGKDYLQPDYIKAQAKFRGCGRNMNYAEAFRVCQQTLHLPIGRMPGSVLFN